MGLLIDFACPDVWKGKKQTNAINTHMCYYVTGNLLVLEGGESRCLKYALSVRESL